MNCAEKQGGSYGESNDTEYGKGAGIVPEYGCHGIKDDPKVAPVTRERVLRMAKRNGYLGENVYVEEVRAPQEKHYNIMVLRTRDAAVYWDRVVSGISEEASLNNCQTRVAVVTEREEENGILPLGLNENIDAIFCIKMLPPEYMQKLVNLGYRIFQLDHYCGIEQRPMGDIVRVDGVQPVSLLTSHLIGQGMTRIGFLSEHSSTYESMHDRYVGFLAAMEQAGIPLDEELVRPNMESDHFITRKILTRLWRATIHCRKRLSAATI